MLNINIINVEMLIFITLVNMLNVITNKLIKAIHKYIKV